MADPQTAIETQLVNIQAKTKTKLKDLHAAIAKCGKSKHGEIRTWLIATYELGYGDANTLAHSFLSKPPAEVADPLNEIYSEKKAHLRPIHDKIMAAIKAWGEFEVAPKRATSRCAERSSLRCWALKPVSELNWASI